MAAGKGTIDALQCTEDRELPEPRAPVLGIQPASRRALPAGAPWKTHGFANAIGIDGRKQPRPRKGPRRTCPETQTKRTQSNSDHKRHLDSAIQRMPRVHRGSTRNVSHLSSGPYQSAGAILARGVHKRECRFINTGERI